MMTTTDVGRRTGLLVAASALFTTGAFAASAPERIVVAGGGLTEIVYALGAGDEIVGTDISSRFPDAASTSTKVGYFRSLSAEGILSLQPDLVVVRDDAGPPEALAQLSTAGVRVETLPTTATVDATVDRITRLGALLHRSDEATAVSARVRAAVQDVSAGVTPAPKVVFIYARGGGTPHVSGSGTAAHAIIELAGGINAAAALDGYRPLTAEALVTLAPDVLLVTTDGVDTLGGLDGVLGTPGVAHTPAGAQRRIVVMDDLYLLGFGPRVGDAAAELAVALRPAP